MDQTTPEPLTIELDPEHIRRVRPAPRKLYAFYLLPLSLAGLAFTLFAYGWPLPVAGCAVLTGIAIGVLMRH
jgi:hypothetical protein